MRSIEEKCVLASTNTSAVHVLFRIAHLLLLEACFPFAMHNSLLSILFSLTTFPVFSSCYLPSLFPNPPSLHSFPSLFLPSFLLPEEKLKDRYGVQSEGQKSKIVSHWLLLLPESEVAILPPAISE